MTSSPHSASEIYAALHPGVQRWIYQKGWDELRPIQVDAARHILFADGDLIVAAPTAGGKTEAAFLPIASRLASAEHAGIGCLCISPLKALINDQYERLVSLFESIDRPLYRWHGDVSPSHKRGALTSRSSALLMTPESLEAMLVRRSSKAATLFGGLEFVVVDELHAFIGTERGRHVQSLLHRLEAAIGRRVRRVALSATLGDMKHAASCLRPGDPDGVAILKAEGNNSIDMQVRGCIVRKRAAKPKEDASEEASDEGGVAIVEHLFKILRGSKNLVFANSRQRTEQLAALLRRACERQRLPNEFLAHHGNLSAEIRQEAEARLKEADRPMTVLCTSTLELGIDVGAVKSVAQVGVPPTVASLRQRLGRSGRGADPAVLRAYIEEQELGKDSSLPVALRLQLIETIAMIDLLLHGWCEPQNEQRLHFSTLVHQVLALVAERGGVRPAEAFRLLCVDGPFRQASSADFGEVLRAMGKHDLLVQLEEGVLALGLRGEREVDHYSFYAVFQTPEEFRVVTEGATLGSLPMAKPVQPEQLIVFAGRWWKVIGVDVPSKTIVVRRSRAGQAPSFDGGGGLVHDRVRAEMFRVLSSKDVPSYLNAGARQLLTEARATFEQYGLANTMMVQVGADVMVLPWLGDRKLNTLELLFEHLGFSKPHSYGALIGIDDARMDDVIVRLRQLHERGIPKVDELASGVEPLPSEKYDEVLPPDLARKNWISAFLDPDVEGVVALLLGDG
jgi:ATP-dependent Lhr-like helicase